MKLSVITLVVLAAAAFAVLIGLGSFSKNEAEAASTLFELEADPGESYLFGTDANGGNLLTVDPGTGVGAIVGPMFDPSGACFAFVFPSFAVAPTTGIMYGGGGGGGPALCTVDPLTGATTLVGDTGLGLAAVGGMDFRSDGTLYAAVNIVGDGGTGSDHLATINTNTGVATVIGPFGACPADEPCTIEGIEGIAFDALGTLWGSHSARGAAGPPGLYTIDLATGAATFQRPIVDQAGAPPSGGVVSIQFACDGTFYGGTARAFGPVIGPAEGDQRSPGWPPGSSVPSGYVGNGADDGGFLITINAATGLFQFVGGVSATGGSSLGALAFEEPCNPQVEDVLDHFKCWRTPDAERIGGFVLLQDQFDLNHRPDGKKVFEKARVRRPKLLCNPVDKFARDGTLLSQSQDPGNHLTFYQISVPDEPRRLVEFRNQFGVQEIVVQRPIRLAVPTPNLSAPNEVPAVRALDHFKCYKVVEAQRVSLRVLLEDQFDRSLDRVENMRVLKPVLWCNPTRKIHPQSSGLWDYFPIENPEAHLVCYNIGPKENPNTFNLVIENQFGIQDLPKVDLPQSLCVPSEKLFVDIQSPNL